MDKSLRIEKVETGFALINLPFEFKDTFRKVFKTAKWDGYNKYWTVGVRAGEKLNEFVSQIQSEIKALDELRAAEDQKKINDAEISTLKSDLFKLKQEIDTKSNELVDFNDVKEVIEKFKDSIIQLQEEKQQLDLILQKTKTDAIEVFESIVNVEKIRDAFNIMKRNFKKVRSENKFEYYAAIVQIDEELIKLNEKGLTSPLLKNISDFNWNRKDKYNPFEINIEEMYKLAKY